jgi:hypothetical protein
VSSCTTAGSSETQCQCIYDGISRQIEFDRFYEISTEISADGTNIPDDLLPIITECVSGSGA